MWSNKSRVLRARPRTAREASPPEGPVVPPAPFEEAKPASPSVWRPRPAPEGPIVSRWRHRSAALESLPPAALFMPEEAVGPSSRMQTWRAHVARESPALQTIGGALPEVGNTRTSSVTAAAIPLPASPCHHPRSHSLQLLLNERKLFRYPSTTLFSQRRQALIQSR
ncbi:hypothetical protein BOTBODRAFT_465434 [Botryobasidium botryosum FD-172 SS1]|uniref:Uncharacterized protein n=1 Tax=Botryobasidium botryosum (strain FD-172 SS1) TaxID=930990 RepID=A0A067MGR5_BOTB1|nr:hypothetical protein BOTBODRAFT_465434 [Botryobasidium botryosum FD-172 SS1]